MSTNSFQVDGKFQVKKERKKTDLSSRTFLVLRYKIEPALLIEDNAQAKYGGEGRAAEFGIRLPDRQETPGK
jgi:hypothetical protein